MLVSSPGCQNAHGVQRGAGYNGRGRGQLADLQSSVALLVVENIPFQHILIVKLFSFSDLLRQLPSREGAPVAPSGI